MNETGSPRRRSFFLVVSVIVLIAVLAGFTRTFYLRGFFGLPALPIYLYVHGALLTAWFALVVTQTSLIAVRRTEQHRRLGMAGVVLALGVVAVSLLTVVQRDAPMIDSEPYRALGNVSSLIGFSACVGAGFFFRHRPAAHKRLMLLGSVQITAPALDRVARLPAVAATLDPLLWDALGPTEIGFALLATLSLVSAVVIHDVATRRRPHPATLGGALCIFVLSPALSAALMFSGAWAAFVRLVV